MPESGRRDALGERVAAGSGGPKVQILLTAYGQIPVPLGTGFRALTGDGWRSSWTLHISDRKARKGKPGSVFTAEVLRLMVFSERWFDSAVPCCPPSTDSESKDLSVRNTN